MRDRKRRTNEDSGEETCGDCGGTGMVAVVTPHSGTTEKCPSCGGTGTVEEEP